MFLSRSSTHLFYRLLDLSHNEQQKILNTLKNTQPTTYQDIIGLLEANESDHLSGLFRFHAQQTLNIEWKLNHQHIDKYKIKEELGRGGIGVVYSASRDNETFEQDLAIKFIQPHFTHLFCKRALFKEAELLARLNHPYIAKVFDGGEHEECVYIVMEKVNGMTLSAYLQTHDVSPQHKLRLFIQVCQALEHAHHCGVLHGDLTLENILIDKQGLPKLIDFNLTQNAFSHTTGTAPQLMAYSEPFASPEQKKGRPLTPLSDIYSLGQILTRLFPELNSKEDIALIQKKATELKLPKRYASVRDIKKDIECVFACRPISLKKHRPLYVLYCLLNRRPMTCFLCSLSLFFSLIFSGVLAFKNHQLQQEKKVTQSIICEMTQLIFESKGADASHHSRLEITRQRILSNPNLPMHIKHAILQPMQLKKRQRMDVEKQTEWM